MCACWKWTLRSLKLMIYHILVWKSTLWRIDISQSVNKGGIVVKISIVNTTTWSVLWHYSGYSKCFTLKINNFKHIINMYLTHCKLTVSVPGCCPWCVYNCPVPAPWGLSDHNKRYTDALDRHQRFGHS